MKTFKTLATDKRTNRKVLIESKYSSKTAFINDTRANGYRVNTLRTKEAHIYDWIIKNTNSTDWDWENPPETTIEYARFHIFAATACYDFEGKVVINGKLIPFEVSKSFSSHKDFTDRVRKTLEIWQN